MFLQSASTNLTLSPISWVSPTPCPCRIDGLHKEKNYRLNYCSGRKIGGILNGDFSRSRWGCRACARPSDMGNPNPNLRLGESTMKRITAQKIFVVKQSSNVDDYEETIHKTIQAASNFSNYQEDPMINKLKTQLGVIHPIPSPPINRNVAGLFVLFFFVGVFFDKLWTSRKRNKSISNGQPGIWPQVPTSFSLFLEKDLQRKESVEWVNMVLGKLWKVYRAELENWVIGLLQPVIDDLKKPDYVARVEIKQFSLGKEPLSVRNVERRTSRRVNDLQYQIGLRYTGGARMLLSLSLKFGVVPITIPVGIRDFDIDGELWVKLRLIPSEPWVGAVSWAFVSLPKIKFELSPFRLFNLMAIPVLSMFLTKLLTEDLPQLFVRPKKIVLDFQKGRAVGPVFDDFQNGTLQEGNRDFVGELSVTLVDARKLPYVFSGKTDPFVILSLEDQVICSKKNSQTTVIGSPGEPIWNQDFHMLVVNPNKQRLCIQVKDSFGFTDYTVGTGEIDLGSLEDTVPTDRIVALQGGWGLFGKRSAGEILLRLTYKEYVEDEEDDTTELVPSDSESDDEMSDSDEDEIRYEKRSRVSSRTEGDYFMNVLSALLLSEEFQGIVAYEAENTNMNSPVFRSGNRSSEKKSSGQERILERLGGSVLICLAVITSIAVLIAANIGGSSNFNP